MVRVDGDLDPETGQTLITALRAVVDADSKGKSPDARTAAQRRADALGEICRRWLDSDDRPSLAGERPHVVVTIDLDSLERRTGRRCELDDAGPITAEAARRWACDAGVTRVIVDAASQPLDVGRRTKVVPPPLRRAVAVRDGGCRFPGCDRPTGWCDAHPGLTAGRLRSTTWSCSVVRTTGRSTAVRGRDGGGPARVLETGRKDPGGPSPAVDSDDC